MLLSTAGSKHKQELIESTRSSTNADIVEMDQTHSDTVGSKKIVLGLYCMQAKGSSTALCVGAHGSGIGGSAMGSC